MNAMTLYAKRINQTEMLGDEKCLELLKQYHEPGTSKDAKDEIKNKVMESNLRLVVKIAHEYKGMGVDFEDLVQCGNKGLAKAVAAFNPSKSPKFSVYAGRVIRNYMHRDGLDRAPAVYRGPWQRRKGNKSKCTPEISMEEQLGEEDARTVGETIEDESSCFIAGIEREELLDLVVKTAQRVLKDKIYIAVMAKFGFGDEYDHPLDQKEIAQILNVTHQRVQQMQKEGLKTLTDAVMKEEMK